MEILDDLKLLLSRRSLPGWIAVILGSSWRLLEHLHTAEWLAHKLFPHGLPLVLQPTPVTAILLICGFAWLTLVIIWSHRKERWHPSTVSQARAGKELSDDTLRDRVASLAQEIVEFLREIGPRPKSPVDRSMTQEEILNAGSEASGEWVNKVHHTYLARFNPRVVAIVHELAAEGVSDAELNQLIDSQVMTGERLQKIAEKLAVLRTRLRFRSPKQ